MKVGIEFRLQMLATAMARGFLRPMNGRSETGLE